MENTWTKQYYDNEMMWPTEPLIRMMRGKNYPNSDLYKFDFKNASLLDVGCGDACNFPLYKQIGVKRMCGVEITDQICNINRQRLENIGIKVEMRTGTNGDIPFAEDEFDILVSWNAGYYMGREDDYYSFEDYMSEFTRVLKSGGVFIFSIPMADHGIFRGCIDIDEKYSIIQNDSLGIRKGIVFRKFKDQKDLTDTLSAYLQDIQIGKVYDDYFGTAAHWYIGYGYCRKKK